MEAFRTEQSNDVILSMKPFSPSSTLNSVLLKAVDDIGIASIHLIDTENYVCDTIICNFF